MLEHIDGVCVRLVYSTHLSVYARIARACHLHAIPSVQSPRHVFELNAPGPTQQAWQRLRPRTVAEQLSLPRHSQAAVPSCPLSPIAAACPTCVP